MYPVVDNSALSPRVLRRLSFMHYTWKDRRFPCSFYHGPRFHGLSSLATIAGMRYTRAYYRPPCSRSPTGEPDKPVLQERKSPRRHVAHFSEKFSACISSLFWSRNIGDSTLSKQRTNPFYYFMYVCIAWNKNGFTSPETNRLRSL